MNITFTPTQEEVNKRLDHVLVKRFPQFSRSFIQKSVDDGHVRVNDKDVPAHHFLRAADTITGSIPEPQTIAVLPYPTMNLTIIHEEEQFIVLEKPTGLIVHQSHNHPESDTLVNALLARYPTLPVGDDPLRPGIVHRLDGDVSGIMLVAKTTSMFEYLQRAFEERRVEKMYTALVYGVMEKPDGTIDFPIARSETHGRKMAARPLGRGSPFNDGAARPHMANDISHSANSTDGEREAVTEYTVLQQYQQYALLEVRPKTGRMHQIRVHCSAIGHPIVGDTMYANKELHPGRAPRLFLHANKLSFVDPEGERREYASPLPNAFSEFLKGKV